MAFESRWRTDRCSRLFAQVCRTVAAAGWVILLLLVTAPARAAGEPESVGQGEGRTLQAFGVGRPFELDEPLKLLRDPSWPLPAAWSLTGLGVASIGTAILLDNYARDGLETMRLCAPHCSSERVEEVERSVRFARIVGGMGMLSLATATWLFLVESPADAFRPRRYGAPRLNIFGGTGGMRVLLTTSFDETRLFRGINPFVASYSGN